MKFLLITFTLVLLNLSSAFAKPVNPVVVTDYAKLLPVINEVPITGTVSSPRTSALSSQLGGLVKAVWVDEGQQVKAGDVVLSLDSDLETLKLKAAIAETRQNTLELADAKRRLADARRLAKNKTISDNDVQALQAEVGIDAAALQKAQALQQQQEARVKQHEVLAPFDGVVSDKATEAGEWITPGSAIVHLIAMDNLRIDFQVPQSVYPKTNFVTPVTISLDAYPGREFDASVSAIVPVTSQQSRTFLVRTTLNSKDFKLIPGMSAKGRLKLDTGKKAVTVSRDAILRHPDGRITVWVVNKDLSVSERLVNIGLSFNGNVVINQGLEAGEKIVVQGNESLREGQVIADKQE